MREARRGDPAGLLRRRAPRNDTIRLQYYLNSLKAKAPRKAGLLRELTQNVVAGSEFDRDAITFETDPGNRIVESFLGQVASHAIAGADDHITGARVDGQRGGKEPGPP